MIYSARQRTAYSALYAIARASVALVYQYHTNTIEDRIMKFSPYGSPIPLIFVGEASSRYSSGPRAGASKRERGENQPFLADRTNGRAYATVLRLSVCRRLSVCDVMYCG